MAMEKTGNKRGRLSAYPPGVVNAIVTTLRNGGDRPNRLQIARDFGVNPNLVYYHWYQLQKERARTLRGNAPTLNPSETNLSGIEPLDGTSHDQSGDKS